MTKPRTITCHWQAGPYRVTGRYRGGSLIELTPPDCTAPVEVINVWDHSTGSPRIKHTKAAVQAALNEWCEANYRGPDGPHNLRHLIETACYQ